MKIKKYIFYTFGLLLLSCVPEVVHAQQVNYDRGSVNWNDGTVKNYFIDNSKHYHFPPQNSVRTFTPSRPSTQFEIDKIVDPTKLKPDAAKQFLQFVDTAAKRPNSASGRAFQAISELYNN